MIIINSNKECCWYNASVSFRCPYLDEFNSFELVVTIDACFWQQYLAVHIKSHDVRSCLALALLRLEGDDEPVARVGHELEARKAVGRNDVSDPFGLKVNFQLLINPSFPLEGI